MSPPSVHFLCFHTTYDVTDYAHCPTSQNQIFIENRENLDPDEKCESQAVHHS